MGTVPRHPSRRYRTPASRLSRPRPGRAGCATRLSTRLRTRAQIAAPRRRPPDLIRLQHPAESVLPGVPVASRSWHGCGRHDRREPMACAHAHLHKRHCPDAMWDHVRVNYAHALETQQTSLLETESTSLLETESTTLLETERTVAPAVSRAQRHPLALHHATPRVCRSHCAGPVMRPRDVRTPPSSATHPVSDAGLDTAHTDACNPSTAPSLSQCISSIAPNLSECNPSSAAVQQCSTQLQR